MDWRRPKFWATKCVALRNGAFLFASLLSATAHAQPKSLDPLTFALAQESKNAGIVNFDNNCPGNLTPRPAWTRNGSPQPSLPPAWQAPCRTLNGADLLKLLKQAKNADGLTLEGVNLVRTPGNRAKRIYLYAQTFPLNLSISYSRIADWLYLDNAHFNALNIEDTKFASRLSTTNMILDDSLKLDSDSFSGLADLQEMHVAYYAVLSSLSGDNNLLMNQASIDGYLFLQNKLQFPEIDLSDSKVGKTLQLIGVADSGALYCQRCVADSLDIYSTSNPPVPIKGNVDFSYSKFTSEISITNMAFAGLVYFDSIGASDINISDSSFARGLWFDYANVSGIVHFGKVKLDSLHLANAKIDKALDMSSVDASSWPDPKGVLDISNTATGTFTDCKEAWPAHIDLDGFSYDAIGIGGDLATAQSGPPVPCKHIGGSGKATSDQGWLQFLSSDYDPDDPNRSFNPEPYTYLASYFARIGNNQYSNDILYRSRVLSMQSAWQTGDHLRALGLAFLWLFAGFGIAGHAMVHLSLTIAGSLLLGLFVMKRSPRARNRSWLWCLGACVDRLLPIVKLLKEFSDYFDEPAIGPNNPGLSGWQKAFFSLYALWGWIIGFLLVAVLSGITQAP